MKLILPSEHASKSAEQQEIILRELGAIQNQSLNVGGIATSILEYLTSRRGQQHRSSESTRLLKQDLIKAIDETVYNEDQVEPIHIYLSHDGRERAQSLFLASLQYDGMVDREGRIARAHESTFQWILREDQSCDFRAPAVRWSNFCEWLKSSDQLYWITGKAGSGKSTLMKFLCSPALELFSTFISQNEQEVERAKTQLCRCSPFLKKWAGSSDLVLASFYFWNSEIEMQMTQEGLLRTLLHQVVAQRPDILPSIAPKYWESLCLFDSCVHNFTASELQEMILRAVRTLSNDSKICFFIDGLEEFGDDHQELISMVKKIIFNNSHVKMCVASRSWEVFQDALGEEASLRLEDLTLDDIKIFVQSKFRAIQDFDIMRRRYPSFANELIDNTVAKASGVFLWVDLVVASLLAGMRQGDRIQDLQRRLDELPPDLEHLYERILLSLDPFYLQHAAEYFSLVEVVERPITILQFSFADEESTKSAIGMNVGSLTQEQISLRIDSASRRLNSRCKGFLEIDRGLRSYMGSDASTLRSLQFSTCIEQSETSSNPQKRRTFSGRRRTLTSIPHYSFV